MNDDESPWAAVAVLPNIKVAAPVEGGIAALVARGDPRTSEICRRQPRLGMFLRRFRDAFGQRLSPAVLITRRDAPASVFTVEALASLRDVIALSTVPYNRAQELCRPHGHRINFSNAFWFYPWMVDRHGQDLIASTPAMLGTHNVDEFRGQSSPEMSVHTLAEHDIDRPLLDALIARWTRRYTKQKPVWQDRALFRSLNMANQASLTPAGTDTTFYDLGRSVAVWVSAFEILAHPGTGKSGLTAVYDLLDQAPWHHHRCREKRYKAYARGNKPADRRSFGCWLYGKLYQARNDFLHGNPVRRQDLIIRGSQRTLFQYAAPLYRMALSGFLPLVFTERMPSVDDAEALGRYMATRMAFYDFQKTIEDGLITVRGNSAGRQITSSRRRSP